MSAVELDTALIVSIAQIIDGDAECHCGAPAVLVVGSLPDNEPGPTCYEHAMEWTRVALTLTEVMFGPKDSTT